MKLVDFSVALLLATQAVYANDAPFTVMFPQLKSFVPKLVDPDAYREVVKSIGAQGGIIDPQDVTGVTNPLNPDNPTMTAGFTFLGQFLDHDITLDKRSALNQTANPRITMNSRTPLFDLDSVYGGGPTVDAQLYTTDNGKIKFIVEANPGSELVSKDYVVRFDLPRDQTGKAIVAEGRNDENLIISQLMLAFLRFHNAVTDIVAAELVFANQNATSIFEEAKRRVTWHYQWIIIHEFLPTTIGQSVVDDIFVNGLQFYNPKGRSESTPLIPIEFSVAAYRFGHSQVRPRYRANNGNPLENNTGFVANVFDNNDDPANPDPVDLRGGRRAPRRFIDWQIFFNFGVGTPTRNKKIDSRISSPLFDLPGSKGPAAGLPSDGVVSLASRNLMRHVNFGLPSGQDVAEFMGIPKLTPSQLSDISQYGPSLNTSTPLWYYILKESELITNGETLGPTGGRIVGEVFVGLLQFDANCYLNAKPDFVPTLPSSTPNDFKMRDLLTVAGVVVL